MKEQYLKKFKTSVNQDTVFKEFEFEKNILLPIRSYEIKIVQCLGF